MTIGGQLFRSPSQSCAARAGAAHACRRCGDRPQSWIRLVKPGEIERLAACRPPPLSMSFAVASKAAVARAAPRPAAARRQARRAATRAVAVRAGARACGRSPRPAAYCAPRAAPRRRPAPPIAGARVPSAMRMSWGRGAGECASHLGARRGRCSLSCISLGRGGLCPPPLRGPAALVATVLAQCAPQLRFYLLGTARAVHNARTCLRSLADASPCALVVHSRIHGAPLCVRACACVRLATGGQRRARVFGHGGVRPGVCGREAVGLQGQVRGALFLPA